MIDINQKQKIKFLILVVLLKKADFNTKITEIEDKIPDVSSLSTKTVVENKLRNISSLVKNTAYTTKVTEIEKKLTDHNHDKYFTTPEYNTLAVSSLMQDQHKQIWCENRF